MGHLNTPSTLGFQEEEVKYTTLSIFFHYLMICLTIISIYILLCIWGWAKFIYMLIMLNFENDAIDDCAILWAVKRIIDNYDKLGE
jgi:hypothetical protein